MEDVQNAAVYDLLRLNPRIIEDTKSHIARIEATPVEPTRQMTPQEVQAQITRLCGQNPIDPATERDNRDAEVSRKAEEYRQAVAKREQEDATARARDIFRSIQPQPETGE